MSLRSPEARRLSAKRIVESLTIDACVAGHTAWKTLDEMVANGLEPDSTYRPSLYTTANGTSVHAYQRAYTAERIADAYDAAMEAAGSPKRAFRGS